MLSDIEIAQNCTMLPIGKVAEKAGLLEDELEYYGKYKAKISDDAWKRLKDEPDGKLILVTAINPTPAGEGKTTTTVGLGEALNKMGKNAIIALREPSLGPVFGIKGGAAGGGYAQVVPMEDINLHFTGDMHAIGAANNLLCAMINLNSSKFQGCTLTDSRFASGYLENCMFKKTALQNLVLENAYFTGTALKGIDLTTCMLSGLHLRPEDLRGCKLRLEQAMEFLWMLGVKIVG